MKSNFFVIDGNNLSSVVTKLYGYAIKNDDTNVSGTGLKDSGEFRPEDYTNGCYVLVQRHGNTITISQDFTGCFGVYLYQKGDYFAISNSLSLLTDYLSNKVSLTLDYDYVISYFVSSVAATAYAETMVKEIKLLPRNAQVVINILNKNINIRLIDYQENTVPINSQKAMDILDNWFYRWVNIIRYLKIQTNRIRTDLTGGMDSRLVFLLFVKSGIDLNGVTIFSSTDGLHIHNEDLQIAQEIADYYHCAVNRRSYDASEKTIPISTENFVNLMSYIRLGSCQEVYIRPVIHQEPLYRFCGYGGETLRNHWCVSPEQFVEDFITSCNSVCCGVSTSIRKILQPAFDAAKKQYRISTEQSSEITHGLYREIRCRNHFGKEMAEQSCLGVVSFAPLLDSELVKISLEGSKFQDRNVLLALIFTRYCPELLNFKFDSGRSIDIDIIQYAKQLNEKFPFVMKEFSSSITELPFIVSTERTSDNHCNIVMDKAYHVNDQSVSNLLERAFLSQKSYDQFVQLFPVNLYMEALRHRNTIKYHPEAKMMPVLSVLWFYHLLNNQRSIKLNNFFDDMLSLRQENEVDVISIQNNNPILDNILQTARIDIKNVSESNQDNNINIQIINDSSATISMPKWFLKNGVGYVITSSITETLKLQMECIHDGELNIYLRTQDIRKADGKRLNFIIDYTKLLINDQPYIASITPATHDRALSYKLPVKEGDLVRVEIDWQRHLYTQDEYNELLTQYRSNF